MHCQGYCRGCCVAVAIDVDHDALEIHAKLFRGGKNNALVCLVRNKAANLVDGEVIALQQRSLNSNILRTAVLNRAAVLVNVVQLVGNGFRGGGVQAAAAGHEERAGAGAIDLVQEVGHANDRPRSVPAARLLRRRQKECR